MMEVGSGKVRITRGSKEDEEFTLLCLAIVNLPEKLLVEYHNDLIRLGSTRTATQNTMLTAIAYIRKQIVKEYI